MKWLRFLFHSLVMTVHAGVVVLFLLSAFSDRISPETSTLFAYLGLGFPIFCLLNLCFTFYWLFTREWKYIWVGLLAFLFTWGQIKLYFPLHSPTTNG